MPPLIGGVTLAVRKWGEGIGGWIGGFPWVAGPISFFIALENSPQFAVSSIPSALLGSIGTIFFALVYAIAAPRLNWFYSVMVSYVAFFVVALVAMESKVSLLLAVSLNLIVLTGVLYVFPVPSQKTQPKKQPAFDIPLRMLVATVFVVVVTQLAEVLGPTWSGILTPFPIMTSTLAIFTHAQQGSAAASRILYGLMLAGYGFVAFLVGVALLLPHFPIGVTYGILVITTMAINGITVRLIKK